MLIILIFHPQLKILNNLKKITLIFLLQYGGFHKIKKDDNGNENIKERIVIKDLRVSPYALKRKHLVELLIIKQKVKDKDTNEIIEKTHFTTIKSISRLFPG